MNEVSWSNHFIAHCGIKREAEGERRFYIDLDERHLNPYGFAHGGILFSLLDTAACHASFEAFDPPRGGVTQCADVHYLHAARGGRITAKTEVLKAGKHTALVESGVYDEQDRLLCTARFEVFYTE